MSKILVFVPSRGAIFLNFREIVKGHIDVFPSPLGELYFLIISENSYETEMEIGFRPLSGSYIS